MPGPLTEADLTTILEGIKAGEDAEELIKLSELADIDVSAQKERIQTGVARLQKMRNVFFPGR